MRSLKLSNGAQSLSVLCIGAHSDDIEIGVGGTILDWLSSGLNLDVHWCVLTASGARATEAKASAEAFLRGATTQTVELANFRDGFLPSQAVRVKEWFEKLKTRVRPDIIFTHRAGDAHQDHREVQQLTWNTFRNHLILEYEIPKWDGDVGQPNTYLPLTARALDRKIELLMEHFGTQRSKDWFDPETFRAVARIRGMESRSPENYAEAFFARKLVVNPGTNG